MTIDEAIKQCLEVAENNEQFASGKWIGSEGEANRQECEQCAADHRQLAEWLTELKELRSLKTDYVFFKAEAKKLLKAAVEDFNKSLGAMYTCPYCKYVERKREVCTSRKEQYCGDICEWRYADEALKLIGGNENEKEN